MKAFTTHTGLLAHLNRGNIDTDQIISKEHLKSIKRDGFGPTLFSDWRYLDDGSLNSDFELNQERFQNASILVAGNNFGCGSSREHAVWAIVQYGITAVIAPTKQTASETLPAFADIFANNSTKNGLLLISLSQSQVDEIIAHIDANPGLTATIDLSAQTFSLANADQTSYSFDIDTSIKTRLLEGLDDIGITEKYNEKITEFEKTHESWR